MVRSLDFALKFLTLAIVAFVAFCVVTDGDVERESRKPGVHLTSFAGGLDVVTIEAEKPAKQAPAAAVAPLPATEPEFDFGSYKPSVKADDTKGKLTALDERVTQLESKFKTFATAKAGSGSTGGGSTGGGSTGSTSAVTYSQSSVGGGSTGSAIGPKVVYQSQPVTYYAPQAVVKPRSPVFKRPATGTCTVDKYGRVICR